MAFNKVLTESQFHFLQQVISSYIARDIKSIIKYQFCEQGKKICTTIIIQILN